MKKSRQLVIAVVALVMGVFLMFRSGQQLVRVRLPDDVAKSLVPVVPPPKAIDLGHRGQTPGSGPTRTDYEGVAIIDSPIDSALNEYARLTQSTVIRPALLPAGRINFRGQGSARSLARELASNLRSQGIRLVAVGEHRVAAVGADLPLLRGNPTGNGWVIVQLLTGLMWVLAAGYFGIRAARSSSRQTTVATT